MGKIKATLGTSATEQLFDRGSKILMSIGEWRDAAGGSAAENHVTLTLVVKRHVRGNMNRDRKVQAMALAKPGPQRQNAVGIEFPSRNSQATSL